MGPLAHVHHRKKNIKLVTPGSHGHIKQKTNVLYIAVAPFEKTLRPGRQLGKVVHLVARTKINSVACNALADFISRHNCLVDCHLADRYRTSSRARQTCFSPSLTKLPSGTARGHRIDACSAITSELRVCANKFHQTFQGGHTPEASCFLTSPHLSLFALFGTNFCEGVAVHVRFDEPARVMASNTHDKFCTSIEGQ